MPQQKDNHKKDSHKEESHEAATKHNYNSISENIRNGVPGAEDELVSIFHSPLITFLTRITRDSTRSEDLTHDTLIIILQKLRKEKLDDPARLPAYIYQTARYVHLGWIRKQDNRQLPLPEFDTMTDTAMTVEEQYMLSRETLEVRQKVMGLRMMRDREILLRRFFADESKPDTCAALKLSNHHYDRVLSRARKRLYATC